MIWFLISKKCIMRCTLLHRDGARITRSLNLEDIQKNCELEFPEYMNTYTLTEGRNFKIFRKENYAIALDSCYLFTKKMLSMELNVTF